MTILANGQVATSKSTIFEVKDADVLPTTKVSVEKVTFFNNNALEQTAILHIKKFSGVSRKLRQFRLKENEGGEYLEPGETLKELENGDTLEAETTNAGAVDFVVFGTRS